MQTGDFKPLEGGCTCRAIRYRLERAPMFVHCCHCRWCQRETGASFALNILIEADEVTPLAGTPVSVAVPTQSGKGQNIFRCAHCQVAVWSHYAGAGPAVNFVRTGTLDDPDRIRPDIHIYTGSKQPWVALAPEVPAVPGYYRREEYWPAQSIERLEAARARLAGG